MRTFIAVDIFPTSEIQNFLPYITQHLKGLNVKYVDLKQLHITLAFLGETTEHQLQALNNELKLLKQNPIELTINGLGVFKSINKPSAIWIGVKPNENLKLLWAQVNKVLLLQGFKPNESEFVPHITIGRIKKIMSNHNLSQFINDYKNHTFGELTISGFVLYQSILTPKGPVYQPINTYSLKA
jgi:2'-5' RNA ligase